MHVPIDLFFYEYLSESNDIEFWKEIDVLSNFKIPEYTKSVYPNTFFMEEASQADEEEFWTIAMEGNLEYTESDYPNTKFIEEVSQELEADLINLLDEFGPLAIEDNLEYTESDFHGRNVAR